MSRDQPIQSYYPNARLRLVVRFEDFGADDIPAPPVKPPHLRKGKSPPDLNVVEQDGAFVLVAPGADPVSIGSPQQQRRSADRRTFVIDGIIPQSATLKLNGIRTADTLSASILYRDLPFDPRTIRSIAVQFFLGTVSARDYQRGIAGEYRSQATPAGALPFHSIPDESIDHRGDLRSNLRFEGWADELESDWSQEDAPLIHLECTDNTRILIDQDAPPRLTIGVQKEIDRAIAEYLANFPQFRGLSVVYLPAIARSEIPKLQTALGKTHRPELGPSPSGGASKGLKVWDYLTDVCRAIGHSIRFQGTRVIIQRPRTLYDSGMPSRVDDPFVPRKLPSGRVLSHRLMIYGRNIDGLQFRRVFSTVGPQNVEVRSYDTAKKSTIVVRYPEKGDRQSNPKPGNANDQKWIVYEIRGIVDRKTLKIVAQGIYESIGRQELGARITTKNLATFGGGNLDPDALDCQPGDAIDVETYRGNDTPQSSVTEIEERIKTQAADFLRSLGFDSEIARAYQEAITNVGLQTTFRVRSIAYDWSSEDGVVIDFELMNYIEIRADKDSAEISITPVDTGAQTELDVVVTDEVQE